MTKSSKVKVSYTNPTNLDFYNRFKPVITYIFLTGIIAQLISGGSESISIFFGTQQEMSTLNPILSIPISIAAVILCALGIELIGRNGLQVCTRYIVQKGWKQGVWNHIMFAVVFVVTFALWHQSYKLSTQGIGKTFTQSKSKTPTLDETPLLNKHLTLKATINKQFDKEKISLENNQYNAYTNIASSQDAKMEAEQTLIARYIRKSKNGDKWAQSHVDKHKIIKGKINQEKGALLVALTNKQNAEISQLESRRATAINKENQRHENALTTAKGNLTNNHTTEKENAAFWGSLFSNLVGLMIALAFICIVTIEIFNEGSGIKIQYESTEYYPTPLVLLGEGIYNSIYNLGYGIAGFLFQNKKIFSFTSFAERATEKINIKYQEQVAELKVNLQEFQQNYNQRLAKDIQKKEDDFKRQISILKEEVAEFKFKTSKLNQRLNQQDSEFEQRLSSDLINQSATYKQQLSELRTQLATNGNDNFQRVSEAVEKERERNQLIIQQVKQQLADEKSDLPRKLAETEKKAQLKHNQQVADLENELAVQKQQFKTELAESKKSKVAEIGEALDKQRDKLTKELAESRIKKQRVRGGNAPSVDSTPAPNISDGKRSDASRNEQKIEEGFYHFYNQGITKITQRMVAEKARLGESTVREKVRALKVKHNI